MIAWVLACGGAAWAPEPDVPHVLIVQAEGLSDVGATLGAMPVQGRYVPAVADAELDEEAWLSGLWPASLLDGASVAAPNTTPQVLSLYGYRTAALVGPGVLAGARAARFDRVERSPEPRCAGHWIEAARDVLSTRPPRPTLLVVGTTTSACPDWEGELARFLEALEPALGRALLVVHPGSGDAGPVALGAPGVAPRRVVGQTVDLLPTVLGYAGAVVPSDAQGTNLGSAQVGEGRPVFTLRPGALSVAAGDVTFTVARPADGWPAELPESPVGDLLPGGPAPDDPRLVRLWPVVRSWYARMRAKDARSRMGNEAFEKMLKEQGYW